MENNRKYNVIVSKRAAKMLSDHAAFLANVSRSAADELVSEFSTAASSLEFMPERCSKFNAGHLQSNKYRRLIFGKRYLMVFQIIDQTVYIDYILDCRRDYSWLI